MRLCLTVPEECAQARLDVFLAQAARDVIPTRAAGQKLIRAGLVRVGGKVATKSGSRLAAGMEVEVEVPPAAKLEVEPEAIPLDILYEDADLIVVNKPRGMVVHPAPGHFKGTLVGALLAHCRDLSGIGGVLRPGVVHRLDKDTSGVLVAAKNDLAHHSLARQIKGHKFRREYLALVHGRLEGEGTLTTYIGRHPVERKKRAVLGPDTPGAKLAVTHWRTEEAFLNYTFLRVQLETGRTHQIRVHMAYLHHPVVGDPVYGPRHPHFPDLIQGQALHAALLGIRHPRTGEEMCFEAPLPPDMAAVLARLRREREEERR